MPDQSSILWVSTKGNMRKNSRVFKIYEAGLDNIDENATLTLGEYQIIRATAAMIAEATAPKKKEKPPLLYDEKAVLGAVQEAIGHKLEAARYGGINRVLRSMSLKADDLALLQAWLTAVMVPWSQSVDGFQFTYSMLVRKLPEWTEKARQHQPTNVGATDAWR